MVESGLRPQSTHTGYLYQPIAAVWPNDTRLVVLRYVTFGNAVRFNSFRTSV